MPDHGKVMTNTIYNIIKTVSAVLFPLIVFPYITRVLQPAYLGKVNFVNSIISYISLMASLGIGTYAVRECAKYRNDIEKLSVTASQIFSINLVSTSLAYAALFIIVLLVPKVRNNLELVAILSIPIIFQTLGCDWINTAMEDLKFISIRTCCFQALSLLAIFMLVQNPEDYLLYAVISAAASVGANIVNMLYRRRYCKISYSGRMNARQHLKPIVSLFVLTLSQTVFLNLDVTMIGFFLGDSDVGIYSVAVKIYNLASTLISAITIVVIPQLSFADNEKNVSEMGRLQKYAFDYIAFLGIPIVIGISLFPGDIVKLIAGENYMAAIPVLRIFSLALFIVMFGGAFLGNIVLLSVSKEKFFMYATLIATIINAVLNYIFIPVCGIIAAGVTTVIAEIVIFFIVFTKGKKYLYAQGLLKDLAQPVIASIPFLAVKALSYLLKIDSYLFSICVIVSCALLYFLMMILLKNEFVYTFITGIKKRGRQK